MPVVLLLVLPWILSASTVYLERYDKWVLDVERALNGSEYCRELKVLVEAPEADLEISVVLREILVTKCKER